MKFVLFLLALFALPCSSEPLPQHCPKTMTVVYYGDWYPYMFRDSGGYKGIDFEFMMEIFDRLGCNLTVDALPEKRAHQGLARGDSLAMSGATITKERQKTAYFSEPYRGETMSLFYLPEKVGGIFSADEVDEVIKRSAMIAINGAAYYGPYIEGKRQSSAAKKFQHVPSLLKRIQMLERHRADAMVEDHIAGCYYLFSQDSSLANKIQWIEVNQVEVAFMFSKGVVGEGFIALFNQTMQQLIDSGEFARIVAKYTSKDCLKQ